MHQRIAAREQKFSSKLVNRVCITEDMICLLEGFTITAINQKPSREDLVDFAASYFEEIRKKRDWRREASGTSEQVCTSVQNGMDKCDTQGYKRL